MRFKQKETRESFVTLPLFSDLISLYAMQLKLTLPCTIKKEKVVKIIHCLKSSTIEREKGDCFYFLYLYTEPRSHHIVG